MKKSIILNEIDLYNIIKKIINEKRHSLKPYNRNSDKYSYNDEDIPKIPDSYEEYCKMMNERGIMPSESNYYVWKAKRGRGSDKLYSPFSNRKIDRYGNYTFAVDYDEEFDDWGNPYKIIEHKTDFSEKTYKNYSESMAKHSDYNYPIYKFIDRGDSIIYKPINGDDSVILGQLIGKNNDIFHPSHFAPSNISKGVQMIKSLSSSKMPVIFTEYLGNMLNKLGFSYIGTIPQIFNGEVVDKVVYVNKAMTKEDLQWIISAINQNYNNRF